MQKILYIDMDNVLVDFPSGIDRLCEEDSNTYRDRYDECPGIFSLMDPVSGAIDAFRTLSQYFDTYILSTAPWRNPSAWSHKLEWVHRHLGCDQGSPAYKRLILSHHKDLNRGDYLIDDRTSNGASDFPGELIQFGVEPFQDWSAITDYLLEIATGDYDVTLKSVLDAEDSSETTRPRNPHALLLGQLGNSKGGIARAAALSPEKRSDQARKAALARWKKEPENPQK